MTGRYDFMLLSFFQGKVLLFIRINGTVVGTLAGLTIHTATVLAGDLSRFLWKSCRRLLPNFAMPSPSLRSA